MINPLLVISPFLILVEEIGFPSSAKTKLTTTISKGSIPLELLISLILIAVGSVSSLTTIASKSSSYMVVPKGSSKERTLKFDWSEKKDLT